MLGTLILKEIHETIITGKFFIASLLCVILIPLGMYVTLEDYSQRLNDYNRSQQLYLQRSEGKVRATFKAEGYRPPSPLSVLAYGLEPFIPNKAVTSDSRYAFGESTDGLVKISNESGLHNPLSVMFGKMDLLFNVGFVLSIFTLLFTFAGITGEREQGTLKLIVSNPVPRWTILLAKIIGNFFVFLMPFLISFLIGLMILNLSSVFPMTDSGILPAIVVILAATIVFLFCMFTFGMLISASTHHSITSIVTSIFIWVIFALVIPKLSPMAAQIIKPVESEQVVNSQIQIARADLKKEQLEREDELFTRVMERHGYNVDEYFEMNNNSPERITIQTEYDELVNPVRNEYSERIVQSTLQLQNNYMNAIHEQEDVSIMISRISPICCFNYLLTEIAGTGLQEIGNFTNQAEQFQEQVKQSLYNKYTYRQYGTQNRGYNMGYWDKPGVDSNKNAVPQMAGYNYLTVREVISKEWIDILLLVLYSILFFAGSFVKFLRYDVR